MTERPPSRRRFSWPIAFTTTAVAVLVTAVLIFERCSSLPGRTAIQTVDEMERVGRDVRNAIVQIAQLQPRVTINDRVYFEQTSSITELALISQRLEVEHEFLHTWAGSTKRLRLHGTFTARAGFDLRQQFSVQIQPGNIIVRLPEARILGVEQDAVDVLAYENGFWNPISGADVQSELSTLNQLARERAAERDLPAQAERLFKSQLAMRLPQTVPLHVVFYRNDARD